MRIRLFRWLLAAFFLVPTLAWPAVAHAQNEVIPRPYVGPLSHPRYEEGGFYTSLEFLYMMQTNPIGSQSLATRGFVDVNGTLTGVPGTYVGSGTEALNTGQLEGPQEWSPGFNLTLGYRFQDGVAVQVAWWHLADTRRNASASVIPANYAVGAALADTFLFAPVFNYPPEFAGNDRNLSVGGVGDTYGIWNAASVMQMRFEQRFDLVEVMGRIPVLETDNYRSYGLFGPRGIVMWENFRWRTVDVSNTGNAGGNTVARYDNTVSNRLYGMVLGSGNEYRLGDTPIGTFSFFCDANIALYADFVKGRARYQLEDRSYASSYKRNMYTLAPGFDAKIGFQWYIYEAITIRLGYNYLGLINTVSSPIPVDFNFGGAHPNYPNGQYRFITGLDFGIGLVW